MEAHRPVGREELVRWAEALAGLARTGLGFTESLYERERFEEILKVAADIRAVAVGDAAVELRLDAWHESVRAGVPGYVTPKVAVAAVVGNEQG